MGEAKPLEVHVAISRVSHLPGHVSQVHLECCWNHKTRKSSITAVTSTQAEWNSADEVSLAKFRVTSGDPCVLNLKLFQVCDHLQSLYFQSDFLTSLREKQKLRYFNLMLCLSRKNSVLKNNPFQNPSLLRKSL